MATIAWIAGAVGGILGIIAWIGGAPWAIGLALIVLGISGVCAGSAAGKK